MLQFAKYQRSPSAIPISTHILKLQQLPELQQLPLLHTPSASLISDPCISSLFKVLSFMNIHSYFLLLKNIIKLQQFIKIPAFAKHRSYRPFHFWHDNYIFESWITHHQLPSDTPSHKHTNKQPISSYRQDHQPSASIQVLNIPQRPYKHHNNSDPCITSLRSKYSPISIKISYEGI